MNKNDVAGKTTCPSIHAWLEALEGTEKAIITMTSGRRVVLFHQWKPIINPPSSA